MKFNKQILNILVTLFLLNKVNAEDKQEEALILKPGPIVGTYDKYDLEDIYDETSIEVQCSGNTCSSSSEKVSVEEGKVTIKNAGTYVIGGDLKGQININADKKDLVHLVLRNMTINSEYGPALYGEKAKRIIITTEGDNSIIDSVNYPAGASEETEDDKDDSKTKTPNACVFVNDNLTFNGKGSIDINGKFDEAIRVKKNLKFVSGKINVKAKGKGIKAKNSISVKEADVNVDAGNSGIKVTKDTDPEQGYIVIDGGKVVVKCGNDGIHAESHLSINGGHVEVIDCDEGLEGQMIDITDGDIYIDAADDGINASKIGAPKGLTPSFPMGGFFRRDVDDNEDSDDYDEAENDTNDVNEVDNDSEDSDDYADDVDDSNVTVNEVDSDDENEVEEETTVIVEEETTSTIVPTSIITTKPTEPSKTTEPTQPTESAKPTQPAEQGQGFPDDDPFKDPRGPPTRSRKDDEQVYIKITGGKVHVIVNSFDTDGIDSNGSLFIGGNAEVIVDSGRGDVFGSMAALDSNGSNTIDVGATVIVAAAGMDAPAGETTIKDLRKIFKDKTDEELQEMIENMKNDNGQDQGFPGAGGPPPEGEGFPAGPGGPPPEGEGFPAGPGGPPPEGEDGPKEDEERAYIKQPYLRTVFEFKTVGNEIVVKDSKDKTVLTYKPKTNFAQILITSPKLIEGETYTISVGDDTKSVTAVVDYEEPKFPDEE